MEARSAQEANRHLMKGTPHYIGIMKLKKKILDTGMRVIYFLSIFFGEGKKAS